ncbi:hypothetical protein [Methanovulcanius yangii]|uniref:hypothetical protein n=1 Tax=Methanovulcanius yangii TaxID=1789227 RepID=UPI0029CA0CC5|nr:hypothetical protein [Methanovulcanius yangii]
MEEMMGISFLKPFNVCNFFGIIRSSDIDRGQFYPGSWHRRMFRDCMREYGDGDLSRIFSAAFMASVVVTIIAFWLMDRING